MKNIIISPTNRNKDILLKKDTNIYELIVPEGKSTYKNKFNILFKNNGIKTKILVKILLLGSNEVIFEPNIIIKNTFKDIDCNLEIRCLIDTDSSRLKVTPSMEVSNPNNKVRHSLTVSTFDNNQINYLLSRGLSNTEARKLLIDAFVDDIIKKIENE